MLDLCHYCLLYVVFIFGVVILYVVSVDVFFCVVYVVYSIVFVFHFSVLSFLIVSSCCCFRLPLFCFELVVFVLYVHMLSETYGSKPHVAVFHS